MSSSTEKAINEKIIVIPERKWMLRDFVWILLLGQSTLSVGMVKTNILWILD